MNNRVKHVKLEKALWIKPKEPIEVLEKGNTLTPKDYETVEKDFGAVSNMLQAEHIQTYYFPACPSCHGIVGQMACSKNVICMKCGREFQLNEYNAQKK
jgi:hypothetical protein